MLHRHVNIWFDLIVGVIATRICTQLMMISVLQFVTLDAVTSTASHSTAACLSADDITNSPEAQPVRLFICPKPCIRFLDVSRYLWTKFALQLLLWPPYLLGQDIIFSSCGFFFFMVALCNRADHYIFALWFLSPFFFFSSPNLSGRRLDVYHTSTHGVVWPLCEFRMHVWNVLHAARWKYRTQKIATSAPSHNFVRLYLRSWGMYRQSNKIVKHRYLIHTSS